MSDYGRGETEEQQDSGAAQGELARQQGDDQQGEQSDDLLGDQQGKHPGQQSGGMHDGGSSSSQND